MLVSGEGQWTDGQYNSQTWNFVAKSSVRRAHCSDRAEKGKKSGQFTFEDETEKRFRSSHRSFSNRTRLQSVMSLFSGGRGIVRPG